MESEEENLQEKQRLRLRRFGAALATYALLVIVLAIIGHLGLGEMNALQWGMFIGMVFFGNIVFFLLFYNGSSRAKIA